MTGFYIDLSRVYTVIRCDEVIYQRMYVGRFWYSLLYCGVDKVFLGRGYDKMGLGRMYNKMVLLGYMAR